MKVLLRWTCWADTFDYSIGSRGVSDNCTALALLKGGVVISAMYNTFIHFSAVPDLHHDTQAALIIPCVLARRWGDTECIPVRASQKQMRWERLLRSEPSRGGKKSREDSCQSRKEGRKCRKKWACECWQQWIYCGNTYYKMQCELILLLFLFPGPFLTPAPSQYAFSQFPAVPHQFFAWTCLALPSVPGSLAFQTGKWRKRVTPRDWTGRCRKKK